MKILALILSLTLLVVTHELGHLGVAKLFHTRVRRFYVFFNWKFSIFKAKKFDGKWHFLFFNAETPESWNEENMSEADKDNTLWGLGWIPLGGYCDIAGMIDETKDAKDLAAEPQEWEYRSKPAWQRLCMISAGVIVNFVSALLIYTCIFAHWGKDELPLRNATLGYDYHQILLDEGLQNGDIIWAIDGTETNDLVEAKQHLLLDNPQSVTVKRGDSLLTLPLSGQLVARVNSERPNDLIVGIRSPFVVSDFVPGSAAAAAGFAVGDSVTHINGEHTPSYAEITEALQRYAGDSVNVGFYRHGSYQEIALMVPSNGKIGVQLTPPIELFEVEHKDYNFIEAIPAGIGYGWQTLVTYVGSLKLLFAKNGAQNLGGFITIGSIFPNQWNWMRFWDITALLAIILAFMNVIPIPGLDGGHIVFTLWEMVTGKKPSDKFLERAQTVGMLLLLALLVIANGNDILRLFHLF